MDSNKSPKFRSLNTFNYNLVLSVWSGRSEQVSEALYRLETLGGSQEKVNSRQLKRNLTVLR